ncbi:MAG: DNA primase [Oscillospiraceae bacterium]|nr:DNA primase [Oscillospiraceae bacterium]
MAFSPAFIDELIARNPIEDVVGQYVNLRRSGANMFGLCPFHGEKTASFSVAPDKGMYYCFGCHKGGGVVNFMMEVEGLSYPDAVRNLAERVGLPVPDDEQYESQYKKQERLWAANKEAARFFHSQLNAPIGKAALEYALGRGMPKATLINFGIGYAPDSWDSLVKHLRSKGYTEEELRESGLVTISQKNGNLFDRFRDRLMFPIIDVRGNVIGFGGRIMKKDENAAKYLNSPETLIFNKRKNLFALNLAKKSKLGYLILVEGYMDAIALHQYGFDCAVASLGTALTSDGAALLSKYTDEVVLIYDGDAAGQNATQRAIPILEKAGLKVRVLQMQGAKDPDEYLKKFGADKFKLLLEGSANRIEYQLNAIRKKFDISVDDEKVQYVQESAELISTLDSSIKREIYGKRVAEAAGISEQAMSLEVEKAGKRRRNREKRAQERIDLAPAQQFQRRGGSKVLYHNVKSGVAEQRLIAMLLREPALMEQTGELKTEEFSVPLFSRVYTQLKSRYQAHQDVSLAVLADVSEDEMSHLAGILYEQDLVSEDAFRDCIQTIHHEYQSGLVATEDDLLAFRNKLRERKGIQ